MPNQRQALVKSAVFALLLGASTTWAALDAGTQKDIERHRAMAAAHEAAAQCLAAGKKHDDCGKQLQAACKGLAIGKYCGMRHEH